MRIQRALRAIGTLFCLTYIPIPKVTGNQSSEECREDSNPKSTVSYSMLPLRRQLRPPTKGSTAAIRSVKRLNSSSISEDAFRLTGDTAFSRQLKQIEDDNRRKLRLLETGDEVSPPFSIYAGVTVLVLASFRFGGLSLILQEIVPKSANILVIAWLPVALLNASWIETLSFVTLLLQPSVRSFLVQEYWPETWTTIQKIILGELWRKLWLSVLKPLPKPLFAPSKGYFSSTPEWFQQGWVKVSEMIDKFVTGLVRKFVEQNVHDSFGILYESMANSILEISILYEETSGDKNSLFDSGSHILHYDENKKSDSIDDASTTDGCLIQ
eukprot:scaffold3079_cov119-Cylindrotheca_fusiformis.AAC.23